MQILQLDRPLHVHRPLRSHALFLLAAAAITFTVAASGCAAATEPEPPGVVPIAGAWSYSGLQSASPVQLSGTVDFISRSAIGFNGSAELRWAPVADGLEWWSGVAPVDQLRVYGYVDGAHLRLREALPGQQTRYDLLSTGAGLSLRLLAALDASLDYAVPLLDGPFQRKGDGRLLFRVTGSY